MMHEHFDFFLRFIADGHTVVYAPDSRVHHGYRPPQPLYKDNYSDFRHFNRTDQVYLTRKWNLKGANLNDRAIEPSGLAAEDSLACPLPELSAEDKVLSCRHWGEHNGTEYWVRVYDRGDVIYKQATLNLAEREARFLRRLNGEYFPRVLNCETGDGYSTITLEKVHGTQPNKCDDTINAHNIARHRFILGCVEILWKLRNTGITHRGIVRENLVVRDGKPVLLDFIWAVSGEDPYFTPVGLARSPEREFCDLYSMGKVLEEVSDGRCPAADAVIKMMTEEFSDSRMLNLDILKLLFSCACEIDGCDGESEPREYKSALYEILTRGFRTKPLQLGYIDRHVQMAEKAAREIVQLVPWDTTIILVDSAQTEIHRWLDRRPCLPMMEKGARYWGAPADGQAAICEIERLKTLGARFAVFAWPALWWLDHYSEMTRWLRDSFKCVLENERLVIFDLRQRGTLG